MNSRKEIKFCLNLNEAFSVKRTLEPYITIDEHCNNYGYYSVNSKYLCKVKEKEIIGKFRIRTYDDAIFLEFKYKQNNIKKKIRKAINNELIYESLIKVNNSFDFIRILKALEFPFIPNKQNIKFGFVEIDYIREAYKCTYLNTMSRITFDFNLITSNQIVDKDMCILEIKGQNVEMIEGLLSSVIKDKKTKYSKYKIAKNSNYYFDNPFNDLLNNMSKSKYYYDYLKYNMNYFLIDKTKQYNELYKKIQFLLYRQIYLNEVFCNIILNIPFEIRKNLIGVKGYFIDQYYEIPRLYGDIDFIVMPNKSFKTIKTLIEAGYYVKEYTNIPLYNNFLLLMIFKNQYFRFLHSFELQKHFKICNENINIEIDLLNQPTYTWEKIIKSNDDLINGFVEFDILEYFLYLVNHIMQHLMFISPSVCNLQINLQKLYDLFIIIERYQNRFDEYELIELAKKKKMIPHLLYVLNVYTQIFRNSKIKFDLNNIKKHYDKNQCTWSNILETSLNMNVSDIVLGDFSNTQVHELNEFIDRNSSLSNQLIYEIKCKRLLKKLNKEDLN